MLQGRSYEEVKSTTGSVDMILSILLFERRDDII